jgi:ankyrin repeat domain-containing protein 50
MDPVSLTVATITLLQTATSVVQICYDYRTGLKDAPKDVARLTEEVASLIEVLESLVKLSKKAESADTLDGRADRDVNAQSCLTGLKLLLKPDGPLDQCTAELEALKEKLTAPTTGWKTTSFGKVVRKLKWPMTEQDIINTLVNIERLKTTFNLALTTDQT